MAEKHVTGREALSKEQQERMDAVRNLLRLSKEPASKVLLSDVDRFERQAGMTAAEKVLDTANDNTPYKDSRMQQDFGCIKAIKSVHGAIVIEVDEAKALKEAKVSAFRVLGPLATDKQIIDYVGEHQFKTTILSVPKFIRNLKSLISLAQVAPENFGLGTGGGHIHDILEDAVGAIRDARAYLRANKEKLPEALYDMLCGHDLQVTDKKKFVDYLGKDWEAELSVKEKVTNLVLGKA